MQSQAEQWLAMHGYRGDVRNNRGEYVFDKLVRSVLVRDEPTFGIAYITDDDYEVHECCGYVYGDGSIISAWDGAYVVFNREGECVFQGSGKRVTALEEFLD